MAFLFQQGVTVSDKITGYKGIIISRMDSITGCNKYCVQPSLDKEGKYQEAIWLDEHCLELDVLVKKMNLDRNIDQPPG